MFKGTFNRKSGFVEHDLVGVVCVCVWVRDEVVDTGAESTPTPYLAPITFLPSSKTAKTLKCTQVKTISTVVYVL